MTSQSDYTAPNLSGAVAVVTGASRGVGKGVAHALGEAGATVYVTGRSIHEGDAPLPGTIHATADGVTARGGKGIAMQCDHGHDDQVRSVFEQVRADQGRLDILVNNVFKIPDPPVFAGVFWEHPVSIWDDMVGIGCRSHYVASAFGAPLMVEQGHGLICNISSFAGAGYAFSTAYGVGKAAVDRMAADMAHELRPRGVAAVSLWPGVVKTEFLLEQAKSPDFGFDIDQSESPEFTGRAIAALASDPCIMDRSGQVLRVAELSREYGFEDVDGSAPPLAPVARN